MNVSELVEFLRDDMTGCPGDWKNRNEAADHIEHLELALAEAIATILNAVVKGELK